MREIFVEYDVESFADIHDDQWVKSLIEIADSRGNGDEVTRLLVHWWGIARSFSFPFHLAYAVSDLTGHSPSLCWDEYLNNMGFKAALWKHAENCFAGLYYAYENLLVSLVAKRVGKTVQVSRGFRPLLREAFNESFAQEAWDAHFIKMSREIRNCIAHCGSVASPQLLKLDPPKQLVGDKGFLTVSATDVRTLYNGLKPIITKALS